MEFNFSTFALEIVNFLILIWILQRLFYKPVLAVIARRKQHIDQTLAEARTLHQEAEDLRQRYENRQNEWARERLAALGELREEVEAERKAQMDLLQADLEQERQKAKVILSRQQQDIQRRAEEKALENGARFTGMLLRQAAGPELEARLCAMLLAHFNELPEECRRCLQMLEAEESVSILITSAYPLPDEMRRKLEQKLGMLINRADVFHYQQDAGLIAGLRLDIGAWVLHANLRHELAGFAEIADDAD